MSLLILKDHSHKFDSFLQAKFLSQIIPAYNEYYEIDADEIYFLALYSSPVSACPLYKATFKGYDRIKRLV